MAQFYAVFFTDLPDDAIADLVTLTMALADGLFIASEVEDVALDDSFELMATASSARRDAVLSRARARRRRRG